MRGFNEVRGYSWNVDDEHQCGVELIPKAKLR